LTDEERCRFPDYNGTVKPLATVCTSLSKGRPAKPVSGSSVGKTIAGSPPVGKAFERFGGGAAQLYVIGEVCKLLFNNGCIRS
jgi:hypothetical protein